MAKAADAGAAPPLLRRVDDGVAWFILNRPEAGNALTTAMRDELAEWFEAASADLRVRAVVLAGTGEKGFCTGADLRPQPSDEERPEGAPARTVGEAARMIRARLAATGGLGARLREAGHRRRQRHRGRGWAASGHGL